MKESQRLGKKKGYSTQLAFVISLIAGSVGTGNIWRFPRVAAQYGSAFMLAYLVMMLVVIIPIMMGEHVMGRFTRHGLPGAFRDFAGKKSTWMGTVVTIIVAAMASYYTAVIAWIVYYLGLSVTKGYYGVDKAELFTHVSNGNVITVVLFVVILAISAIIAYKGVNGIEKANKVFIPVLFVCLIITGIRSLTLPGATEGLNYLFSFELKDLVNYKIWLEALTQAIWSAGPGWGLCITLAVFSKAKSDVALTSTVNGFGDMLAAMLAGVAVIPAVFAFSASSSEALELLASGNNGLTFLSLTNVFENMPGGYFISIAFFLCLLMAGLSSNVCHFMITSLPWVDAGVKKKKAVIIMFFVLLIWGLPSAWNANFLSNQDWVVGQMEVIGVMFSCFALIKFGVRKVRTIYLNNKYTGIHIGAWWEISVKFLAPLIAIIMLVWWCIQSVGWDANWWNPFGIDNLGTFVAQGALMILVSVLLNNKIADKILEKHVKDDGTFPEIPDNEFAQ